MIYGCTSRYGLVRVQRHNRLQAEEFAQAVRNHIEFAHAAVDNYSIYLDLTRQLGYTLLQNIKNRIDNILRILQAVYFLVVGKLQIFSHKRLQNLFYSLLSEAVVIGVTDAAHVAAYEKFFGILLIIPAKTVIRSIAAFCLPALAQLQLQLLRIVQQLRHNRLLFLLQLAHNLGMCAILSLIVLKHYLGNGPVKVIAAQKRISVGSNLVYL